MNELLTDHLIQCECCPRKCRVNRIEEEVGFCRIGSPIQISHIGHHFGEEPPISGTKGSGTIFFAGCNLCCAFCQNYQISQEFYQNHTRTLTTESLGLEMLRLQDEGVHNINFVSPSHMIFHMAEAIQIAKSRGLIIPVVYNTNGYDSVDAIRQIRGLVDIYLPDIKYMENGIGKRFSAVEDYADIVPEVLREMLGQVGHLITDEKDIAKRGLLVRHLVLPGYLDNSRRCIRSLADLSLSTYISIMSQYSPQYRACDYPGINRTLKKEEYEDISKYALDLGLENVFVQELDSQNHYLPDFTRDSPFNSTLS